MSVGMYQHSIAMDGVPGWMVGGHAHLGVLSILAIVIGFVVDQHGIAGRLRSAITGLYVVGQWMLPMSVWIGVGAGVTILIPLAFVWGAFLIVAMLLLAWQVATTDLATTPPSSGPAQPADD